MALTFPNMLREFGKELAKNSKRVRMAATGGLARLANMATFNNVDALSGYADRAATARREYLNDITSDPNINPTLAGLLSASLDVGTTAAETAALGGVGKLARGVGAAGRAASRASSVSKAAQAHNKSLLALQKAKTFGTKAEIAKARQVASKAWRDLAAAKKTVAAAGGPSVRVAFGRAAMEPAAMTAARYAAQPVRSVLVAAGGIAGTRALIGASEMYGGNTPQSASPSAVDPQATERRIQELQAKWMTGEQINEAVRNPATGMTGEQINEAVRNPATGMIGVPAQPYGMPGRTTGGALNMPERTFTGYTPQGYKYSGILDAGGNSPVFIQPPEGDVRRGRFAEVFGGREDVQPGTEANPVDRGFIGKGFRALSGGSDSLKSKQAEYSADIKGMRDTRKERFAMEKLERRAATQAKLLEAGEKGDEKAAAKAIRELAKDKADFERRTRGMDEFGKRVVARQESPERAQLDDATRAVEDRAIKWWKSASKEIEKSVKDGDSIDALLPDLGVFNADGRPDRAKVDAFVASEKAKGKKGMTEKEIADAINKRTWYNYLVSIDLA